ncbi:cobW-domain-containing protein [Schizopora paradoxa]|uniref:CobW-domain-containing protein n=1 Tax=Schizopora paradoxa TaxID=27342 RepID=A0A0H2RHZ0_9AGAM|nr:cobW-domain-containing protein [Schizopora paradoxa]
MAQTTQITVFTGFLGAGKTTLILSLLPQLPQDYKTCMLKNEYGDVEVDSQLAKQSNLSSVNEILNGCMCCTLVGRMKDALLEIKEKYNPDRIFVETSGSAFPATLAFQIRELERETNNAFKLDAIVTVIDAENFTGYEDTSQTAKMQAAYSDVILINKWEHLSERDYDTVLDHLYTLNDSTPKIKCNGKAGVDPNLIFGLDSKLFQLEDSGSKLFEDGAHNDEVETLTVFRGAHPHSCHDHEHHDHEHDTTQDGPVLSEALLTTSLATLSKDSVWRVKGFVTFPTSGQHILNWAFGRYELTPFEAGSSHHGNDLKLTMMGERGEVKRFAKKFSASLGASLH